MKKVLLEGEEFYTQGRNVWIGRGGGSSAVAVFLGDVPKGDEASETINR